MKTLLLLSLMMLLAFTASAADVAGTWKASMETPNGSFENTFVFKVDGSKLTGTIANQMSGEQPITDGKIEGESVSFTVTSNFNGNEFKLNYAGKVTGPDMKLVVTVVGRDRTFEMTAKKTS